MACLWTVKGVEMYHEENVALTDWFDEDVGSEKRCHVTPANGEPISVGNGDLPRNGVA